MENEKKPGKVKEFWNKHKGKVKVGLTAVAAFTVGALLATPNKEDRDVLKTIHGWGPNPETKRSFGQNLMLVQSGSKNANVFGCYPDEANTLKDALDDVSKSYTEKGMDPNETKATGIIVFTK